MTATITAGAPTPVPAGRGRWRLTAYRRQFSTALPVVVAELGNARGRRLEQKYNTPAMLTFTVDGHAPEAALITELATDVVATRWNDYGSGGTGTDEPVFRGLIDHSEDQLTEQSATVTFTAHDYFALLGRRIITATTGQTTGDQDSQVQMLLNAATVLAQSSSGTGFSPGSYLPLSMQRKNPDGTNRSAAGPNRVRQYFAGQVIGTAIDDLAKVQGGFDYAVGSLGPSWPTDWLYVYYPQQGVTRTDMALVYGVNVSGLTRTVSSADYANYVRVIGNNGSADPAAPQFFSERWNTDANNVTVNPVGLWQTVENAADVTIQSTLDDKAAGDLAWYGQVTPTYTLTLRPGTYQRGYPNMGDTVPLYVQEGRLNVNTTVRVVGIDYSIGDDGQEDVTLTVGRPPVTMAKLLTGGARDIDALVRR